MILNLDDIIIEYIINTMKIYPTIIKEKAFKLRRSKKSYKEIKDIMGIPKSTLSAWFGKELGVDFNSKGWLEHLADIRVLAVRAIKKKKFDGLEKIRINMEKEVLSYPLKDISFQKSLLAMLYWSEGSKHAKMSGLKFTNTDPKMIDLFIRLLRTCYQPDEKKFYIYLQLHYYHPIRKTKKFWSDLTNIPESQFHATIIKKRSRKKRFRQNYMGICSIGHASSAIRKEMMAIAYAIQKNIGNYHVL
jgi:hypothetical protein